MTPFHECHTLLRGGACCRLLAARLLPDRTQHHAIVVKESSIEVFSVDRRRGHLQLLFDSNVFEHILDAAVVSRGESSHTPDAIILLSHQNLITILRLSPDSISLEAVSSTSSLFLSNPSAISRPSRLMSVSSDGAVMCLCSFVSSLWLYPISSSLTVSAPTHIELAGVPWAAIITNVTEHGVVTVAVGVYTRRDMNRPNSIQVITVDLHHHRSESLLYGLSLGESGSTGVGLIQCTEDHLLCVMENSISLISSNASDPNRILFNGPMPAWLNEGAEHRRVGTSPLLCSHIWVRDRLLFLFESGDIYHVWINGHSIEFRHLGCASPASSAAYFPITTVLTPGHMESAPNVVDMLMIVGDCSPAMMLSIDWNSTFESALERVQDLPSTPPITDFDISPEAGIVALTGLLRHGCIDTVERGIATTALCPPVPGFTAITRIIPLKTSEAAKFHDMMVLCFVESTRVLSVGADGYELVDCSARLCVASDVRTLAVALFAAASLLVQCHSAGLTLVRCSTAPRSQWTRSSLQCRPPLPSSSPTAAALLEPFIAIAYGTELLLLRLDATVVCEVARLRLDSELSCIELVAADARSPASADSLLLLLGSHDQRLRTAVLTMQPGPAKVYDIRVVSSVELSASTSTSCCIAESIRLVHGAAGAFLFVGTRDGVLLRQRLVSQPSQQLLHHFQIGTHAMISGPDGLSRRQLGRSAVSMSHMTNAAVAAGAGSDGWSERLLLLSDRVWMLFADPALPSPTLQLSPLSTGSTISSFCSVAVPFNCVAAQNISENALSIAVIHDNELSFRAIAPTTTLFTRSSIRLKKTGRRLICDPSSGIVVVSCTDVVEGRLCSRLYLAPAVGATAALPAFKLKPTETVHSLFRWSLNGVSHCCVGTAVDLRGTECSFGRLLIFAFSNTTRHSEKSDASEAPTLRLVSGIEMGGIVCGISTIMDGSLLVCSASNRVFVFELSVNTAESAPHLSLVCESESRNVITSMSGFGSSLALVDMRLGVAFYRFDEAKRSLSFHAIDPCPRLVSRVLMLDEHCCVAADKYGVIFFLSDRSVEQPSFPVKNLQTTASFNLGESASQIRRGSVRVHPDSRDVDTVLVSTLSGSVFALQHIADSKVHGTLVDLQSLIAEHPSTKPLLGNSHGVFRSSSTGESKNVIDGDLLLAFSSLSSFEQQLMADKIASKPSLLQLGQLLQNLVQNVL